VKHPELVKEVRWDGGADDGQFYAALSRRCSAMGRLCMWPKGCGAEELSTYFRINAAETGQFERTLLWRGGSVT